jgi:hypothetical protein
VDEQFTARELLPEARKELAEEFEEGLVIRGIIARPGALLDADAGVPLGDLPLRRLEDRTISWGGLWGRRDAIEQDDVLDLSLERRGVIEQQGQRGPGLELRGGRRRFLSRGQRVERIILLGDPWEQNGEDDFMEVGERPIAGEGSQRNLPSELAATMQPKPSCGWLLIERTGAAGKYGAGDCRSTWEGRCVGPRLNRIPPRPSTARLAPGWTSRKKESKKRVDSRRGGGRSRAPSDGKGKPHWRWDHPDGLKKNKESATRGWLSMRRW